MSDSASHKQTISSAKSTIMLIVILLFVSVSFYSAARSQLLYDQSRMGNPNKLPIIDAQQSMAIDIDGEASLTPETMLSAPRRSSLIPDANGRLALYQVSTYSFQSHSKISEIRVLNLGSKESKLLTDSKGASSPQWIEEDILYLRSGQNGSTEVFISMAPSFSTAYIAAKVPGPISDLKLKVLESGKVAMLVASKGAPDGSMYNPEMEPPKLSSGLIYDAPIVRHWDTYVKLPRNSLFYGLLRKVEPHITEVQGRYSLSKLHNALRGTALESPVEPFPGTEHFDLSKTGIIFVASDPSLNPAFNTKSDAYYLPILDFEKPIASPPCRFLLEGFQGASSGPVFAPDGKSAIYFHMKKNGYESDKRRLVFISDVTNYSSAVEVFKTKDGKGGWDRSPEKGIWSNDQQSVFLTASNEGRTSLFQARITAEALISEQVPRSVFARGSVKDVSLFRARSDKLLISSTSLIDNSIWTVLDPSAPEDYEVVSSNTRNGSSFSLKPSQVSDMWFTGAKDRKIHAWIVRPSFFNPNSKYPLAYLIHGGPQGAWEDSWSTRWNPAVFAEQGYVVITPNPTGSISYGQAFTDDIKENWGGSPYEDLVAGFKYIEANLKYVDIGNAVALGASYGGYMINWINGHPLGRRFKALVCHDGVFSMANQMSSDEQYFPTHDLGGFYWENRGGWERWDPARFLENWKTPQLVIHSEKDYRLPISEGLAAFNVLQAQNIESRFLTFPDENHWVLKEENSLLWHTVVLNWINKFVGLPKYRDEPEAINVALR